MLVGRLREAEDQLLSTRQEETMSTLVQTKIKLAQADYVNLELQVRHSVLNRSSKSNLHHCGHLFPGARLARC